MVSRLGFHAQIAAMVDLCIAGPERLCRHVMPNPLAGPCNSLVLAPVRCSPFTVAISPRVNRFWIRTNGLRLIHADELALEQKPSISRRSRARFINEITIRVRLGS